MGQGFESLQARLWWVWCSWLARQIVVLDIVGSSPTIHPYFLPIFRRCMMGYRQAVRHRTLTPAFVGSNPTSPVEVLYYGALAQSVEHLTFNQVVRGSNPRCFTRTSLGLFFIYADVAELADALDLGSSGRPCRFDSCHPQPKSALF